MAVFYTALFMIHLCGKPQKMEKPPKTSAKRIGKFHRKLIHTHTQNLKATVSLLLHRPTLEEKWGEMLFASIA